MPPTTAIRFIESLQRCRAGLIDLWALEEADPRADIEGWDAPFDATRPTSPEVEARAARADEIRD